jgi:membrane protease YdiL (CAAX protease family)
VLAISFGFFEYSSFLLLIGNSTGSIRVQNSDWSIGMFQEITSLLLLVYVLSRRKLRLRDLGLRWSISDLFRGTGLFVGSYCAYWLGYFVVNAVHDAFFGLVQTGTSTGSSWGHMGYLAIPFVLVNPVFEEMIVRAYLMTEIRELTGSATLAAVLSVGVQVSYHLYYGWQGALMLIFPFLVFAVYYARTRNATPALLAHGITDAISIFRLL